MGNGIGVWRERGEDKEEEGVICMYCISKREREGRVGNERNLNLA